ncbi:MAG: pilin [Candidatus Saccharibacteria bacterium]
MKNKFLLTAGAASSVAATMANRVYAASCDLTSGVSSGAQCAQGSSTATNLADQIKTVTNTLLYVLGIIAVIMIIVGGLRYALSGGNENATRGAKDTILYAVIGLVVASLAFAIVNYVLGLF